MLEDAALEEGLGEFMLDDWELCHDQTRGHWGAEDVAGHTKTRGHARVRQADSSTAGERQT